MLTMTHDRLLVQEVYGRQSAGGIVLPDFHFTTPYDPHYDAEDEFAEETFPESVDFMPQLVDVLAKGPDVEQPLEFEERVYISKSCGEYMWLENARYLAIYERDILYRPVARRPYHPRHIAVRQRLPSGVTNSGIFFQMDRRLPPWLGEVVSLGSYVEANPDIYPIAVGDTVVFKHRAGREIPDPDDPTRTTIHVFNVADILVKMERSYVERVASLETDEREPAHA